MHVYYLLPFGHRWPEEITKVSMRRWIIWWHSFVSCTYELWWPRPKSQMMMKKKSWRKKETGRFKNVVGYRLKTGRKRKEEKKNLVITTRHFALSSVFIPRFFYLNLGSWGKKEKKGHKKSRSCCRCCFLDQGNLNVPAPQTGPAVLPPPFIFFSLFSLAGSALDFILELWHLLPISGEGEGGEGKR